MFICFVVIVYINKYISRFDSSASNVDTNLIIFKTIPQKDYPTGFVHHLLANFPSFLSKLLEIRQYYFVVFGDLKKNLMAKSDDNLCAVLL